LNSHYDGFKELLELRFNVTGNALLPSDWIVANTSLKGKRYSFDKHEYQIAFANDKHRIVAAEKCAQIGFTEILLRWILCFLVQHQGSQAIFTQPTATDVGKFAKSRVDTCFDECAVIKRLGTGGIDSAQLKKIGTSFLNLSGTFGTRAAISVPSDANVYDEVNFSNPKVLNQYKSRLQHSEYKLERCISTPTVPGYGVSGLVNKSDQKHVMLKCNHCGHQQILVWPDSIWLSKSLRLGIKEVDQTAMSAYIDRSYEFTPYIACDKCEREVVREWKYQEWVAKYPEKARDLDDGISGYVISQLDVPFVAVREIIKASDRRLEGYNNPQDFYNFILGKAYAGGDSMPVTDAVKVLATILMSFEKVNGTFVGVDLGNICHIVVVKDYWLPGRDRPSPIVVATKKIPRVELEDLADILNMFGAIYTVSDAQPYTTTVEKIALARPGKMSICFFGGKKPYSIAADYVQVTANRTQMLDAVTSDLSKAVTMVASCIENYDEFWTHCKNLIKVKAEDDDGTVYYEYVKVNDGDDHFGYAYGYALLARRIFFEQQPQGLTGLAPVSIEGYESNI
jgi:hypothetical protein